MPTGARLMAAISLAVLAFILSGMVVPLMPESTDFGYFLPLNIVLGLLVGWSVMGRRAGRGITAAINNGLAGVFVLVLWAIFLQAANEMVRRALRNRYDDPFEAIVAKLPNSVRHQGNARPSHLEHAGVAHAPPRSDRILPFQQCLAG